MPVALSRLERLLPMCVSLSTPGGLPLADVHSRPPINPIIDPALILQTVQPESTLKRMLKISSIKLSSTHSLESRNTSGPIPANLSPPHPHRRLTCQSSRPCLRKRLRSRHRLPRSHPHRTLDHPPHYFPHLRSRLKPSSSSPDCCLVGFPMRNGSRRYVGCSAVYSPSLRAK